MTDESPTAPTVTAAALRDRVAASRERIADAQQRALRAHDELARARTSATSPDRVVTVTVDAAGTLLDLSLRPAEAVGRTRAIVRDVLGTDAPALDSIAETVAEGGHR